MYLHARWRTQRLQEGPHLRDVIGGRHRHFTLLFVGAGFACSSALFLSAILKVAWSFLQEKCKHVGLPQPPPSPPPPSAAAALAANLTAASFPAPANAPALITVPAPAIDKLSAASASSALQ